MIEGGQARIETVPRPNDGPMNFSMTTDFRGVGENVNELEQWVFDQAANLGLLWNPSPLGNIQTDVGTVRETGSILSAGELHFSNTDIFREPQQTNEQASATMADLTSTTPLTDFHEWLAEILPDFPDVLSGNLAG